jgi:D-alanine transaminase
MVISLGFPKDKPKKLPRKEVEEREFSLQEVYEADECFFTATPLEIFPVVQIGDEQFGAGERGPITKKLQVAYEESIRLFKVTN